MKIDLTGLEKITIDQYDPRHWVPIVTIRPPFGAAGTAGSIYLNTDDNSIYINTGKSMEKI